MAFEVNDIVITYGKVHLIVDKTYSDFWDDYSYKTMQYGFINDTTFVLEMKDGNISPGTDGMKNAFKGRDYLFNYIFTKCKKVVER